MLQAGESAGVVVPALLQRGAGMAPIPLRGDAAYHPGMASPVNTLSGTRSLVAALLLFVQATGWAQGGTFTLYRSSALDQLARVHVGTFDAADGTDYNRENCELARQLFQSQPGARVRFWCEKGTYTGSRQ